MDRFKLRDLENKQMLLGLLPNNVLLLLFKHTYFFSPPVAGLCHQLTNALVERKQASLPVYLDSFFGFFNRTFSMQGVLLCS